MAKKILVALSGGVDSSAALALLKQQGEDVSAAYMKTWMNEEGIDVFGDCPWHQDITDCENVCKHLGVNFEAVDFIKEYREEIVEYLVEGYRLGRTPNPDVMCNRRMKFGKFLDFAKKRGFDTVATGHYCSMRENSDGSRDLEMGADPSKDQSYFLVMMTQAQLQAASFPIGSMLKSQVRDFARMEGLPNSEKKDSQGICFLGKIKIQDFLRHYIPESEGDIINRSGKVLGKHKGLFNYTLGQRKGIGVPSNTDNKRYVVVAKDFQTNSLIIDFDSSEAPDLYKSTVNVVEINWINKPVQEQRQLYARVRYRDELVKVLFTPLPNNKAMVEFETPQRAIAPGQVMAIHDTNQTTVLGGAFFA